MKACIDVDILTDVKILKDVEILTDVETPTGEKTVRELTDQGCHPEDLCTMAMALSLEDLGMMTIPLGLMIVVDRLAEMHPIGGLSQGIEEKTNPIELLAGLLETSLAASAADVRTASK